LKTKLLGFIGASLTFVLSAGSIQAASFFPNVSPGDIFTGQITIDPIPATGVGDSLLQQYVSPNLGVITVNIGGETFSQPITLIQSVVFNVPNAYLDYSWSAQQEQSLPQTTRIMSFDGMPLPEGQTYLRLIGSTTSTGAIFPESLSSYTSTSFTLFAQGFDGSASDYFGVVTTLAPIPSSDGAFSFAGTITEDDNFPAGSVASVPEPSTWAMLLIGFAGIGSMAYRRKQNGPALSVA
jgi:hypothetical protein